MAIKLGIKPNIVFSLDGDYTAYHTIRNDWRKIPKKSTVSITAFNRSYEGFINGSSKPPITETHHTLGYHSAQFTMDVHFRRVKKEKAAKKVLDAVRVQVIANQD